MADQTTGRPAPEYDTERETNIGVVTGNPFRTSWGAIFAGTVSGLAIYLILGLIGLAAGIGAIDPVEEARPLEGVPYGLGIWWVLSALAAFFAGGVIAGRLAGQPQTTTGALHGLTVGSLTLLLIAWVATSAAGSAVSGAAGAVASLFGGSGTREVQATLSQPLQNLVRQGAAGGQGAQGRGAQPGAGEQEQPGATYLNEVATSIRNEAMSLFRAFVTPAERQRIERRFEATYRDLLQTPGDANQDVQQLFEYLLSNQGVLDQQDEERARQILMNQLGVSREDADMILERWKQRYEAAIRELQQLVNDAEAQLNQYASNQAGRQGGQAGTGQAAGTTAQSEAVQAVREVVSPQQQERTREIIQQSYNEIMNNPSGALPELRAAFDRLFGAGDVWSEEDLQELRTLIGERTGLTEQQVNKLINRWQTRYQEAAARVQETLQAAEREAAEAAERTLNVTASALGWTSFALVLALGSAVVGGDAGSSGRASAGFPGEGHHESLAPSRRAGPGRRGLKRLQVGGSCRRRRLSEPRREPRVAPISGYRAEI